MLRSRLRNVPYLLILISSIIILSLAIRDYEPRAQSEQVNLTTAIETVARQAIPAVVHIEVTERREVANPLLPFENDPFFRHFFGNPQKMPKKFQREIQGLERRAD